MERWLGHLALTMALVLSGALTAGEAVFRQHQGRTADVLDFADGIIQTIDFADEQYWEDGRVATLGDLRWQANRGGALTAIQGTMAILDCGSMAAWEGKRIDHVLANRIDGKHNPFLQVTDEVMLPGAVLVFRRHDGSKTVLIQLLERSEDMLRIAWTEDLERVEDGIVLRSASNTKPEDVATHRAQWLSRMWVKSIGINPTVQALLEERGDVFAAMDTDAALTKAIGMGDEGSLAALLHAGAPIGQRHMDAALGRLDPVLTEHLMVGGGSLPARAATIPLCLRRLPGQYASYQSLQGASSTMSEDVLIAAWEALLDRNQVNPDDLSAADQLAVALWTGDADALRALTDEHEVPDQVSFGFGIAAYTAAPILHALKAGHTELIEYLGEDQTLSPNRLLQLALATANRTTQQQVIARLDHQPGVSALEQAWSVQNPKLTVIALEYGSTPAAWMSLEEIRSWLTSMGTELSLTARIALRDATAIESASSEGLLDVNWAGLSAIDLAIRHDWLEGLQAMYAKLPATDKRVRDDLVRAVQDNAPAISRHLATIAGEIANPITDQALRLRRFARLEDWCEAGLLAIEDLDLSTVGGLVHDGSIPTADREALRRLLTAGH